VNLTLPEENLGIEWYFNEKSGKKRFINKNPQLAIPKNEFGTYECVTTLINHKKMIRKFFMNQTHAFVIPPKHKSIRFQNVNDSSVKKNTAPIDAFTKYIRIDKSTVKPKAENIVTIRQQNYLGNNPNTTFMDILDMRINSAEKYYYNVECITSK
jgi:hypothetical protein